MTLTLDSDDSGNEESCSSQDGAGPSTGNQRTAKRKFTQEIVDKLVREAEKRGEQTGEKTCENRLKRKIQDHAECRICLKVPKSGIQLQQCPNGHITCEACMENCGDACPTCRIPLSSNVKIRALAIEQIIDAVDLDRECKHSSCDFSAPKVVLAGHEKSCNQRPVPCPESNCNEYLSFSTLIDHIKQHLPDQDGGNPHHGPSIKCQYETNAQDLNIDGGWGTKIMTYQGKQFITRFVVANRVCHAWIYILGHSEEAESFQVTIYIGEGQQSALAHHGKVFPIDLKEDDIIGQKSGVLSFSLGCMGSSFFRKIPVNSDGNDQEVTVHYSIVKSKAPHHLAGLHKLRKEGEVECESENESEN